MHYTADGRVVKEITNLNQKKNTISFNYESNNYYCFANYYYDCNYYYYYRIILNYKYH